METEHPCESAPDILIVDDTPANLKLLASMLRERGYMPRTVSSGERALEAVRLMHPDLILLDISMPDMDGFEVCERLKADADLKDIPILFLSALTETMVKVKAFRVGGEDYITKPFRFEEVEARVRTQLELHRQRRELRDRNEQLGRLEALLDDLTNVVSHDMCSHLMTITLQLEIAMDSEDKNASCIGQAQKASTNLNELMMRMLDVSRSRRAECRTAKGDCELKAVT